MSAPPAPCPDCAVGKHEVCGGLAWDHDLDEAVPCPCLLDGHPR